MWFVRTSSLCMIMLRSICLSVSSLSVDHLVPFTYTDGDASMRAAYTCVCRVWGPSLSYISLSRLTQGDPSVGGSLIRRASSLSLARSLAQEAPLSFYLFSSRRAALLYHSLFWLLHRARERLSSLGRRIFLWPLPPSSSFVRTTKKGTSPPSTAIRIMGPTSI